MNKLDDSRIRGVFSARNLLLGAALLGSLALATLPATPAQAAMTAFLIGAAAWLRAISRNQLQTIQIEREHQPRVFEGDRVPVLLRVRRGAGLSVQMIELHDQFAASMQQDRRHLIPALARGWEVLVHYESETDRHRGLYTVGPLLLRAGDPLGVFFEEREADCFTRLTVYPKPDPLPFYTIPGPQPPTGHSMDFVPQVGYGEEILGVREYRPGDPPARVHWRTSARRGGLHVLQLNQPVRVELAVLLDLTRRSRLGLGAESATEVAVRAAISILGRAHDARHRFALSYAHESEVHFPAGAGLSHLHMLLDRLVVLTPAGETDYWAMAAPRARALTPGSRAVFIVAAMNTPVQASTDLVRELVAARVGVDCVLLDEREFIRIYRDQELDRRRGLPEFPAVAAALERAGARVFPLGRARQHLAPPEGRRLETRS